MTIAFTGHRPNKLNHIRPVNILGAITNLLAREYQASQGNLMVITGGALGADQMAALATQNLRALLEIGLQHVLAIPFEGYDEHWSEDQREVADELRAGADHVEVLQPRQKPQAKLGPLYHARNRWMVDRCDLLVAVWNGDQSGGTAATYRYAQLKGVRRHILRVPRPNERSAQNAGSHS